MKLQRIGIFCATAILSFSNTAVYAGAYIGSDGGNANFVLHPSDYSAGSPIVTVDVCISPSSSVTTELEIPLQNVIANYNQLQATTGNLFTGNNNNIPSGRFDSESVLLHEVGHCLGMAHVNLASESGLSGASQNYTKSTTGTNGSFNLGIGSDGIRGSSDDIRGDDTNLHWFKMADNNPFTLASIVDSTTYSRDLSDLPSGSYAANGDRSVGAQLGFGSTEAVMQQGTGIDEAQRTLSADEVATLLFGASGIDEIAGTSDDYTIVLNYLGITNSGTCDISVSVNSESSFAFCSLGFQGVGTNHGRVTTGNVRLAQSINWFYNQEAVAPINMSPEIDPIADVTVSVSETIAIAVSSTDPDADDSISLSLSASPSFCSLTDNGNGSGTINCSPTAGQLGEFPVTVTATDNGDPILAVDASFTVTVLPEGVSIITECKSGLNFIPDGSTSGLDDALSLIGDGAVTDIDVKLQISHSFVGDLVVTLQHVDTGSTVTLIDQPGIPATAGCEGDAIDAIIDDEGTDGNVEDTCAPTEPTIFGSLTPNSPLSTFDGEAVAGTWLLNITDSVAGDSGFLAEWCVTATVMAGTDTDGDGVFDATDNCTLVSNADQRDTNGDGFGNACDADFNNNCIVNFIDVAVFGPAFNSGVGDPNYDEDIDSDGNGVINFLDLILIRDSFVMPPGPSANECIIEQ